jgi:hypothetical protein
MAQPKAQAATAVLRQQVSTNDPEDKYHPQGIVITLSRGWSTSKLKRRGEAVRAPGSTRSRP